MARPPRPQSTIAQIFADDLDAMFGLTPEVEQLTQTVENKKLQVFSNERELHELEARLRKAEQRLARVSRHNSPSASPSRAPAPYSQEKDASESAAADAGKGYQHPLAQRPTYPADRPPTAGKYTTSPGEGPAEQSGSRGAVNGMTAGGGMSGYRTGSDFVMVDRNGAQAQRGYG